MLLLHISDIHFRREEIGSPMDPNQHLRNEILRDAGEMCKRLDKVPEAILVSGDLAFRGHVSEYEFALGWLEQLCAACGTTTASVFVIPGNHDIIQTKASSQIAQSFHKSIRSADLLVLDELLRGILLDSDAAGYMYAPLSEYNQFAVQFFCDLVAPERTLSKRDLRLNDGSILRLFGLNSALISSKDDVKGELVVDPGYNQITKQLGVINVVLCHHPFAWLRNGDALSSHLNDVATLQLFGHEHNSRIEQQRKFLRIHASAANPNRKEAAWEPGYNLLELQVVSEGSERTLDIKAHIRVWQMSPSQFHPKMDGQNDFFQQTVNLEGWEKEHSALPQATSHQSTMTQTVQILPPTIDERGDPMDIVRNLSLRFFKLTLSEKSAIAGKLSLFENEDLNQPDFIRFRNVFLRARDRNLLEALEQEISQITKSGQINH